MESKFIGPKKTIGASQVGSILGLNYWCSKEQLKDKLTNGYTLEPNVFCNFGNNNEPTARCFYEHYKKIKVKKANYVKDSQCLKFSGVADGLIGNNGGLEIKCHRNSYNDDGSIKKIATTLKDVPSNYLSQMVAYMYLYKRSWWDFMSCVFNEETNQLRSVKIHRIYWKNHKQTWETQWYPQIIEFVKEIQ